ncbi:hypothetical protein GV794_13160 [Nocardia cyriacigeorgica]|uniref:Uncharacterized protein n=1 Tax=Nocardia cyriacigeorgica TaxID=135487 RepID=A0A6P1CZ26_9NOCA|nr:hypothetical protein [Nocardia cyriacigeorgica]NEW40126.1 hypothetical protein [Nocardia cyriacigeorgica]NEW43385.1 hypothetical protein [Nocardia cyriacigeorgica]NEW51548.1 hypothetical protein [Nocardia cyriacigeorgica]NEW56595.1 hypothetical protein [Nocardia cyriacigeorgica]
MSIVLNEHTEPAAPDRLRLALRVDGWATGAFGAIMLAGAIPLRDPLGLPTSWSIPFGVAMIGGGLALLLIAGYPAISGRHAAAVVAVNGASAVGMTVLAFSGLIDLTGPGVAFLLFGALIVAGFAGAEYSGLRQAGPNGRSR